MAGTALLALVLLASCTTTNIAGNRTGWSDYANIAIKDYIVVGSVRVESEEIIQRGFLGIANRHTGSLVTYDSLMAEARRLGADDIINVRIDRIDESAHGFMDWFFGYTERYRYQANALAIKYAGAASVYLPDVRGSPAQPNAEGLPR